MSDPNKIIETVAKEAYSDLVRPSTSPIGEAISGIIKAVLHYPRYWAKIQDIILEEKVARFKQNLIEKTNKIPQERKILPHPSILGPSIQALEYAIVDDEISDLFANLIASAMDSDKNTHPSFVEIIKQVNSDEAKIIKGISEYVFCRVLMIVSLKRFYKASFTLTINHSNLFHVAPELSSYAKEEVFLDNLKRLEIINIKNLDIEPENFDNEWYMKLKELCLEEYMNISRSDFMTGENEGFEYEFYYQSIEITSFGRDFIRACVGIHN
jgi:hypothetical protein